MISIFDRILERVLAEQTGNIQYSESEHEGVFYIHAIEDGQAVGEAIIYPDMSLAKGSISSEKRVWRLQAIGATEMMADPDRAHSRGIGRELWRRIFAHIGTDWLANSQLGYPDDRRAVASIEKLAQHGWIKLHWITGAKGANFIAKLTEAGKEWVASGPSAPPREYDTYVSGALVQPDYLKWSGYSLPRVGTIDELLAQSRQKDPVFIPTRGILDGQEFKLSEQDLTKLLEILGDAWDHSGIFSHDVDDEEAYLDEKVFPFLRTALQAAIHGS